MNICLTGVGGQALQDLKASGSLLFFVPGSPIAGSEWIPRSLLILRLHGFREPGSGVRVKITFVPGAPVHEAGPGYSSGARSAGLKHAVERNP